MSLGLSSHASCQLITLSDYELADAISLGAEQPELDDLFITEVLGEIGIDLIFVDGMLALFEQIRIMQRCFLTLA